MRRRLCVSRKTTDFFAIGRSAEKRAQVAPNLAYSDPEMAETAEYTLVGRHPQGLKHLLHARRSRNAFTSSLELVGSSAFAGPARLPPRPASTGRSPSGSSTSLLRSRSRRSPASGPRSCACTAWPPQKQAAGTWRSSSSRATQSWRRASHVGTRCVFPVVSF